MPDRPDPETLAARMQPNPTSSTVPYLGRKLTPDQLAVLNAFLDSPLRTGESDEVITERFLAWRDVERPE